MKKIKWTLSVLPFILTAGVMQFMPERVPSHYDMSGNIDGYGSKYVYLIMPAAILCMTVLFSLIARSQRKRAIGDEKKTAGAVSNEKVFDIIAASSAVMLGIMQGFILYSACAASNAGADKVEIDQGGIMSILMGLFFIVCGNFLPKTKLNGAVGLRVSYSMYNDNTWRRSNRFGGYALMIAGVLCVVTALFTKQWVAVIMMFVYLTAAVIASVAYAKKVYDEEIKLTSSAE